MTEITAACGPRAVALICGLVAPSSRPGVAPVELLDDGTVQWNLTHGITVQMIRQPDGGAHWELMHRPEDQDA